MVAALTAVTSLAWLTALVSAALVPGSFSTMLYAAGSVICHQIPDRSFAVGGTHLPVCARCLGIYAGVAAAALAVCLPVVQRRALPRRAASARRLAVLGAVPTVVTVIAERAGVWAPSNGTRAAAGAILGAGLLLMVMSAVRPAGPLRGTRPTIDYR